MQTGSDGQFAAWDDDRYSTHIERFDEQHRRLFGLLNDLHTAMEEGHSEEEVGDILRELERYTEYHFGDEEEFMQDCGYAMDCANCFYDHREAHEEFARKVSDLREKHENGEYVTMEVLGFVRDWLDSHIAAMDEDQSYGEYYREEVDDGYEYDPGTLRQDRRDADAEEADWREDAAGESAADREVTLGSRVVEGGALALSSGSMATWFETVAETHGDRTAAVVPTDDGFTERSFADLSERAREVAGGLLTLGVEPGDRLAVAVEPRYEWSVVDLACHLAGVVSVPVYPSFDAEQTRNVLERTGATGLVTDADPAPAVESAVGVVVDVADLPTVEPRSLPGFDAADDDVATVAFDLPAGSDPRATLLTHGNLRAATAMFEAGLPLDPGAVGTCFLPLAHVYQRVATYYLWATGGAVAYPDEGVEADLAAVRPDVLVGAPAVYRGLYGDLQDRIGSLDWMRRKVAGRVASYGRDAVEHGTTPLKYRAADRLVYGPLREECGLDALTYALSGTAPLDDHLLYFLRGFGVPVCEVFGPVECAGVGALNGPGSLATGAVGEPMDGTEFALSDEGELLVCGPNVTPGYLDDERATADVLREGWYHTGEAGELGADDRVYRTD